MGLFENLYRRPARAGALERFGEHQLRSSPHCSLRSFRMPSRVRQGSERSFPRGHASCEPGAAVAWSVQRIADLSSKWAANDSFGVAGYSGVDEIFVNTSAFVGTNPTDELITSGLPVKSVQDRCQARRSPPTSRHHRINPAVEAAQKLLFHPTGWRGASEWQEQLFQKFGLSRGPAPGSLLNCRVW